MRGEGGRDERGGRDETGGRRDTALNGMRGDWRREIARCDSIQNMR